MQIKNKIISKHDSNIELIFQNHIIDGSKLESRFCEPIMDLLREYLPSSFENIKAVFGVENKKICFQLKSTISDKVISSYDVSHLRSTNGSFVNLNEMREIRENLGFKILGDLKSLQNQIELPRSEERIDIDKIKESLEKNKDELSKLEIKLTNLKDKIENMKENPEPRRGISQCFGPKTHKTIKEKAQKAQKADDGIIKWAKEHAYNYTNSNNHKGVFWGNVKNEIESYEELKKEIEGKKQIINNMGNIVILELDGNTIKNIPDTIINKTQNDGEIYKKILKTKTTPVYKDEQEIYDYNANGKPIFVTNRVFIRDEVVSYCEPTFNKNNYWNIENIEGNKITFKSPKDANRFIRDYFGVNI